MGSAEVEQLWGTWQLVSNQIKVMETGEVRDYEAGATLSGYINYGPDGRMMGILVRGNRPKAPSLDALTDPQRVELFKTMVAYGGTYELIGSVIHHHIDISWNQAWTGTTQIREVRRDGELLVYNTKPAPLGGGGQDDGRMGVSILTWKKVR
jgi:hypothetical protein